MTRRWLQRIPVLWISACALLAASVPAAATTLTWSVVPSPSPGSGYNVLSAVSCVSPAACTAVGYDVEDTGSGATHTLAESWNGTRWSVKPSPTPRGVVLVNLAGVSCVSAARCVAVGYYETSSGSGLKALIESWNGTSWSVVPSPHPASSVTGLDGVSCVSATACTAVGFYYLLSKGVYQTFAESWNGTRWSMVPSPSPASGGNVLEAVSCTAARACTAVGSDYENPNAVRTLAESWNGTSWSVVPSPDRPGSNALDGVSCVSATACTAVGWHGDHRSTRALIESWDGAAWSLVTSPNPGSVYDNLYGVSCPSAAACTAVGKYTSNANAAKTLVESWNGIRYSVLHSPDPGTVDILNGVSCAGAACTAVGSNGRKTLIESGG